MSEIITAYYDRQPGTVNGFFSLKAYDPETRKERYLFEKLPARSGQQLYADTDNVTAKSPIHGGNHFLWIDTHKNNGAFFPDAPGAIGQFYSISTSPTNRTTCTYGSNKRTAVGLHPENAFPGSAGCVVLLHEGAIQQASVIALFSFLDALGKSQPTIKLKVV